MSRRRTTESQAATHLLPFESTQLHLPPEICELICGLVDRETLLHLGKVSRVFHHQAQRDIYRTVDLLPGPSEALISWCRTVSRDPQLGVYLHSLTLCSPTVGELERLACVLDNCPNLKRLAVHSTLSYTEDRDTTHTWATEKAPFRLTHLSDSSGKTFTPAFWNTQTEIRLLSLPLGPSGERHVFPCREDQLPNLVALEVESTAALPTTPRPLERIQFLWSQRIDSRALGRFSATLTTLNLCDLHVASIASIISLVADAVPNLLHLGIAEDMDQQGVRSWPIYFPSTKLTRLTRLKSFVLHTYSDNVFCITPPTSHVMALVAIGSQPVAEHAMEICPNLEEVIIGGYNQRQVDGKRVRMEETWKLTRVQTTRKVSLKYATGYDFDAVGRFWDAKKSGSRSHLILHKRAIARFLYNVCDLSIADIAIELHSSESMVRGAVKNKYKEPDDVSKDAEHISDELRAKYLRYQDYPRESPVASQDHDEREAYNQLFQRACSKTVGEAVPCLKREPKGDPDIEMELAYGCLRSSPAPDSDKGDSDLDELEDGSSTPSSGTRSQSVDSNTKPGPPIQAHQPELPLANEQQIQNDAPEPLAAKDDLEAFLHHGISPKLDLSTHLARFTTVGMDIDALQAIAHWERVEASDTLMRLLAQRPNAPGLSPFQLIALEHALRAQAQAVERQDVLPAIATLDDFLAHPMLGVALTHHRGLFLEQGVASLTDLEVLADWEDWEDCVDMLKTLFGTKGRLTQFELLVLEKGVGRLRVRGL
ncbi:hypothetical protein C8F01DRAFT_1086208 [Mycena amicta]|nr:hypothetical protein C8F01DRAFT_1086208 [Mycena amicta]